MYRYVHAKQRQSCITHEGCTYHVPLLHVWANTKGMNAQIAHLGEEGETDTHTYIQHSRPNLLFIFVTIVRYLISTD